MSSPCVKQMTRFGSFQVLARNCHHRPGMQDSPKSSMSLFLLGMRHERRHLYPDL